MVGATVCSTDLEPGSLTWEDPNFPCDEYIRALDKTVQWFVTEGMADNPLMAQISNKAKTAGAASDYLRGLVGPGASAMLLLVFPVIVVAGQGKRGAGLVIAPENAPMRRVSLQDAEALAELESALPGLAKALTVWQLQSVLQEPQLPAQERTAIAKAMMEFLREDEDCSVLFEALV